MGVLERVGEASMQGHLDQAARMSGQAGRTPEDTSTPGQRLGAAILRSETAERVPPPGAGVVQSLEGALPVDPTRGHVVDPRRRELQERQDRLNQGR